MLSVPHRITVKAGHCMGVLELRILPLNKYLLIQEISKSCCDVSVSEFECCAGKRRTLLRLQRKMKAIGFFLLYL